MDNPDRLGGAETNTVTQELVVNMVTEASLVVLTVRNTQPEQIGPDQTRYKCYLVVACADQCQLLLPCAN